MGAHSKNQAWLSKVVESPLEPELPICDPHHHLWDQREGAEQPRYLLDEMLDNQPAAQCRTAEQKNDHQEAGQHALAKGDSNHQCDFGENCSVDRSHPAD